MFACHRSRLIHMYSVVIEPALGPTRCTDYRSARENTVFIIPLQVTRLWPDTQLKTLSLIS